MIDRRLSDPYVPLRAKPDTTHAPSNPNTSTTNGGINTRATFSLATAAMSAKDRGTLLTVQQTWDYTAVIMGKERETRSQWQKVRTLILEQADVAVVSWHVRLALLQDAKLGPEHG
jgi:hypothetical protein